MRREIYIAQLESRAVAHEVTLIPGDGTGPELTEATRRVLEATGVAFEWDVQEAGADVMERYGGNPLPDQVLDSIKRTGVALKGPITTPVGGGFRSVNVTLRKTLDLYGQVRPCKSYPGVRSRYEHFDLIIGREATEDLYAGIEYEEGSSHSNELAEWIEARGGHVPEQSGVSIKPPSVGRSRRIVEFAFDYARRNGRRKVTAVHKANIMKFSDGLFLRVAREGAEGTSDREDALGSLDVPTPGRGRRGRPARERDRRGDPRGRQRHLRHEADAGRPLGGRDERGRRRDHRLDGSAGLTRRKVTVVGGGNVGATCAQLLATRDYCDVVLVDIVENLPQGKALDINQMGAVLGYEPTVVGSNGYEESAGSDVVVITAGVPRKPGMSRDDLVTTNEKIVGSVTEQGGEPAPGARPGAP